MPSLIKTKRLLLRDFQVDDWPAVHEYASDLDVVRYVEWGPNDETMTRAFIERVIATSLEEPRRDYQLAVYSIEAGTVIGAGCINVSNPSNREGWIGYCLNKRFWGGGIATEVAQALVTFGFGELGLHRIFATCDPLNLASAKVLQNAGMTYEGRFKSHKLVRGAWRDTAVYAVSNPRQQACSADC